MKISFVIFTFFASIIFVNVVLAITPLENIKYPIAELGNCKDKKNCYMYCEKPENILRCVDFGEKNKLISTEDAFKARKFSNVLEDGGPGECKNQRTCEQYCKETSHINECLTFAEKHELVPLEQLKEAKIITKVLQDITKLPGGCKDQKTCKEYCSIEANYSECIEFGKKAGLISDEMLKQAEGELKQAPPEMQNCFKSIIKNIGSKTKNGEVSQNDFMSIIMQNCLPSGIKIPSGVDGRINKELLKKMQEFYGNSLSPKDLESLKELQGLDDSLIPQGNEIPSLGKTLNMEEIKGLQQKMEEEYKKLTPEELEWLKKAQEQGQIENSTQTEIPKGVGGGSGMGM
ncbi:MAG: hypothetical protein WC822_00155 [Candidatus Paceibacterota bacterium]|jgi:hypothetical protein